MALFLLFSSNSVSVSLQGSFKLFSVPPESLHTFESHCSTYRYERLGRSQRLLFLVICTKAGRLRGDHAISASHIILWIFRSTIILCFTSNCVCLPVEPRTRLGDCTDLRYTGNSYGTFQQYVRNHHLKCQTAPIDYLGLFSTLSTN